MCSMNAVNKTTFKKINVGILKERKIDKFSGLFVPNVQNKSLNY